MSDNCDTRSEQPRLHRDVDVVFDRWSSHRLTVPAHQPTTITGKFGGGDGIQHAILVCSAKSCTKESQIAETDLTDAPASFELRLPGLDPGTSSFQDPVHPATANGTLYVIDGS